MLVALLPAARADAESLDVELFHPRFGVGVLGVDGTQPLPTGTVQAGVLLQYTHDPLVLYDRDDVGVAVVRERATFQVGGRWQPWEHVGLRLSMPIVADWGGEDPDRSADGVGVGDLWAGALADFATVGPVRFGAHVDVAVPVGTRDAWRGDASIRVLPGGVAEARFGRVRLFGELSTVLRPAIDTGDDLVAGVDLLAHAGAAWEVWTDHASLNAALLDRIGLADDRAPTSELLVGLTSTLLPGAELDVQLGRGLTLGYGAPDYRVGVGLTFRQLPSAPPEPEPIQVSVTTVPEAPEPEPEPEPVVVVAPAPVAVAIARVEEDQIVLSEPIQFELGTDRILPISLPTLHEVAKLLHDHPEIAQLVIEGHASEEGSFIYNYDLSLRRASAIFKELVLAGVHPDRLSCRAMGEVAPVTTGDEALAKSRRVVFRIARRLAPGEALPAYTRDIKLPWNGEPTTIPEPPPLAAPPPPPPPAPDPDAVPDPDLFEEEDE